MFKLPNWINMEFIYVIIIIEVVEEGEEQPPKAKPLSASKEGRGEIFGSVMLL